MINETPPQTWEQELARLDIADEESKGCTVSLGEFLHSKNFEIIKDFIAVQRKQACRGEKLKKALNNFKRTLRSKFELSEDVAFFYKQGDKLIFDMGLFYFLPEKAQISL